MNIQDEQRMLTSRPADEGETAYTTGAGGNAGAGDKIKEREEHQGVGDYASCREALQSENNSRAAIFGGLSGGIFIFGLVVAILSGHFLPVFLVALALASLIGPFASTKPQARYAGFQGFVFLLGLAVCSVIGWWPWILVVFGIAALLSIGNGFWSLAPVISPTMIAEQYYTAIRNQDYGRAYEFLDTRLADSLSQEQFISQALNRDEAGGTVSGFSIAPDLTTTTTPLAGEPLPRINFARNPAESVIVTVIRTNEPAYPVHLQIRQGKITAFDRI